MATIITTKNPRAKTTLVHNIHDLTVRSNLVDAAIKSMSFYPLYAPLQEARVCSPGLVGVQSHQERPGKMRIIAGGLNVCEAAQASHTRNVHVQRYANWTIQLLREADAEYRAELVAIEEANDERQWWRKWSKVRLSMHARSD